jgi:anthranilate synthase component 1
MMIMDKAVVFDHVKNQIQIIVLADGTPDGYEEAGREIGAILGKLKQPLPPLPAAPGDAPEFTANMSPSDYEAIVRRCVQYIVAGDAFQIVPSQRFEAPCTAHPLQIYRALRSLNPSPYMYLLRLGDTDVVGASPEILVGQSGDEARVRPIAGTRRRGANPEEDKELAADLLQDKKERAEHIMLVDLGRNDLGRVCEYGSVRVKDLMVIEHYSHVMHIVSEVVGTLRPNVRPSDLVRATFPAGTLSGAPKVRAMEIIEELEPTKRGLYGGCVGYFSAAGDFDLAIAIRTALIRNGVAYVQAGAGIVFDSVPSKEHQECVSKAQAVVKAIQVAHVGLD